LIRSAGRWLDGGISLAVVHRIVTEAEASEPASAEVTN
jgi:hypothetical protein